MEIKTLIFLLHVIYLSSGIADIHPDSMTVHITIKVFADDLQNAIIHHSNNKDMPLAEIPDNYLIQYFNAHLTLSSTDKELFTLDLEKKEFLGELYVLYFRFSPPKEISEKIIFKANYFMELFPGQVNVFKIKLGSERQYFLRFTQNQSTQTIEF